MDLFNLGGRECHVENKLGSKYFETVNSIINVGAKKKRRKRGRKTKEKEVKNSILWFLGWSTSGGRVLLHDLEGDVLLAATDNLHVRDYGVFLAVKNGVDLLQSLAFGLDPVTGLRR